MVTDRCSTAGLLFILAHLYPAKSIYFLYILLLDFSSHWMHMYSSRGHHKTGLHERNFLLRVYYGCYPLFGYCCVGSEVFYMLLYILAFDASYKIPLIQLPLTHVSEPSSKRKTLYLTLKPISLNVLALLHCVLTGLCDEEYYQSRSAF